VVQVVRAARDMQLVLKLGHLVGHLFYHLRRLVLDYFPFHVVPGMICAQEEDVLNKGGEARVRSEHRFLVLVDACEPVADRGWYPPLAVGEAVEDPEFLEEPQEEPAL